MSVAIDILEIALWIFIILLFARSVIAFIASTARDWKPKGLTVVLVEATLSATDIPVRIARRIFPPVRLGGVSWDISILIVILVAWVVVKLLALAP